MTLFDARIPLSFLAVAVAVAVVLLILPGPGTA